MNPEIQDLAERFAANLLSPIELHKLLSARVSPIDSELEADLWALTFEIADGETSEEEARRWLLARHDLDPFRVRSLAFAAAMDGQLVTVLQAASMPLASEIAAYRGEFTDAVGERLISQLV